MFTTPVTNKQFTASAVRLVPWTSGRKVREVLRARYRDGRVSFYSIGNNTGWCTTKLTINDNETLADALNARHRFEHIELETPWMEGEFAADQMIAR